jgi:hypothetical protein
MTLDELGAKLTELNDRKATAQRELDRLKEGRRRADELKQQNKRYFEPTRTAYSTTASFGSPARCDGIYTRPCGSTSPSPQKEGHASAVAWTRTC